MDKHERANFRQRLLTKLRDSFVYNTEPIFTLSSGRKSHFYIDCKKVTLDFEGAFLVGQLILDAISNLEADAIGGMTLGADPIATSVSILSYGEPHPIPAFIIRKEPKPFGRPDGPMAYIEGHLPENARVVVVDDVLTGGRATERTIHILKEAGCTVMKVIALVDRKEGGRQHLEALGYAVESLFTVEDLLKE
ncbi:MAG TPA: orotate phosphoribosyltransferase [Nitrospiria bacterium]|nr:orotate phosphoribosyltransferase [Nitrospiria bacterium]